MLQRDHVYVVYFSFIPHITYWYVYLRILFRNALLINFVSNISLYIFYLIYMFASPNVGTAAQTVYYSKGSLVVWYS